MPFMFGSMKGSMTMGNIRAKKSPTAYTPSFKALFFKIRGQAPTGTPTGFRFRPITPGFKFIKRKKKIIKIRKVKL